MRHENIVKLYEYTENEKEIVLLMEYINDANYFEEKLEEVCIYLFWSPTDSIFKLSVKFLFLMSVTTLNYKLYDN